MSAGAYLLGCALLLVFVVPLAYGSWSLRGWLIPQWSGGPARLAECVIGIATVVVLSELLGTVHAFKRFPVVLGTAAAGVGLAALGRRGRRSPHVWIRPGSRLAAANRTPRIEVGIATIAAAVVGAEWAGKVAYAFDKGMTHLDTISFHGPYAAEFFQRGYLLGELDRTDPRHAFGGQTSELLHSVLALAMGRETFSPLVNVGWAALAILAAWCLGRRHGVGALCVLGAVVVLGLPMIGATQPGQASSDILAAALLLASIAILYEGGLALAPTTIAGLAAGLALSTKGTVAAPVAVLTIGVILLSLQRERGRVGALWSGAVFVTGSYWFIRNIVVAHNPIPYFTMHLGPVTLDSVMQRHAPSVSKYLFDATEWNKVFIPGFHTALGIFWPLVVFAALAGTSAIVIRGRPPLERLVAIAVLAGLVAYLFTPFSADGLTFLFNVLFAAPALLSCLCLIPLGVAGRSARWRYTVAAVFGVIVVVDLTQRTREGVPAWPSIAAVAGPLAAIAIIGGVIAWFVFPREHWSLQLPVRLDQTVITVLAALLLFFPVQLHYFDSRYVDAGLTLDAVNAALHNVHHAHIASFGTTETYPFFGTDLSNRVDQLEAPAANSPAEACRAWLFLMGDYDYVVIAHSLFVTVSPPELALQNDRNVTRVVDTVSGSLYKVTAPPAANGC